jgi:sugar-specific transcriptional regulator TrmB
MDYSILKKLGLDDKELKVYLKLLEYGASSVRNLAELAELNRGTTYDVLKSLQERGLVSFYHQETKQKFVAEDPEILLDVLKKQSEDLEKQAEKISEIIPELKSLQDKEGHKPVTRFYEGKIGVRKILQDVLDSLGQEDEYYVYSAKVASEDLRSAFPDFTQKRIKAGIKVRSISLAAGGNLHGLDERRWLGTDDESATFIILYKNKSAYISRDLSGGPVGVIIENRMIYETQKLIFLRLWNSLK